MSAINDFIEQQLADCLDYVDKQFSYYKSFFSDDMTTVIMADHSQPIYDKTRNDPFFMFYNDKDRISHVTFIISDQRLKAGIYDGLISMLDFNSIMKKAVFEHEIKKESLKTPVRTLGRLKEVCPYPGRMYKSFGDFQDR